ncbi:MAG TPA: MFS transporter [Clostridia bacterium]
MYKEKIKYVIFIAVTVLFWFSLYSYVPIFPGYIEKSGVSHGLIGIIIGSYGFTQMLVRIPLGIVSDRLNRRKIFIILGIIFSLISGLGLWLSNSAWSMLIYRSMAGIAASSWVTFSILFSSYYKNEEATKAVGYLLAANGLGQVLAMLAGSAFAGWFGEKSSFLLAAAAAAIGLIIGVFIVENRNINNAPIEISQLFAVAKSKNLIVMSILGILLQFITYATVYGFTPIAAESFGVNSSQLGLLTALSVLPSIPAGALSGSFFGRKYGEKKTLIYGFVVTALTCIAIPFIKSFFMLVVTQFIGGFGRGVAMPLLMGLCIKNVEESKRGTAMGVYQAIYGLGMFGGPVIVGFISDMASLNIGFIVTFFVGLIAAVIVKIYVPSNSADI